MVYIREFEIFESEGWQVVFPCDMPGATEGRNLQEAVEMAVDWLRETVIYDLATERETVGGELGHEPEHGGRIVVIAVDCDLRDADAVTAAEAARLLGVSSARVSQMCESGLLTSFKVGATRLVMRDSVNARLEDNPGPGRPRKSEGGTASA